MIAGLWGSKDVFAGSDKGKVIKLRGVLMGILSGGGRWECKQEVDRLMFVGSRRTPHHKRREDVRRFFEEVRQPGISEPSERVLLVFFPPECEKYRLTRCSLASVTNGWW